MHFDIQPSVSASMLGQDNLLSAEADLYGTDTYFTETEASTVH